MSLHLSRGMARLTVIGTGWSNTSIESGTGFTSEGELVRNVADDLLYGYGNDVDWDFIAETECPGIQFSDVIYTDESGTIYTDPDLDGIWTNPATGIEYPGGGEMWIPESTLTYLSDILSALADSDSQLAQYSIPDSVLPSLYGGKVTTEIHAVVSGSDRPHYYTPACWYIQRDSSDGILFLGEPFYHGTASGGSITVYDDAFSTRDGSAKAIYYSNCTTRFTDSYLPSPYSSYPIAYVAWQCIYGSLGKTLLYKTEDTITTESIVEGSTDLEYKEINGMNYYKVNQRTGG